MLFGLATARGKIIVKQDYSAKLIIRWVLRYSSPVTDLFAIFNGYINNKLEHLKLG